MASKGGDPDFERRMSQQCSKEEFMGNALSVVVLGASGDLAKKKTYPALYDLFTHDLLPRHVTICGYARSEKNLDEFRASIGEKLEGGSEEDKEAFLARCEYFSGGYDSEEAFEELAGKLAKWEEAQGAGDVTNRLFYFAIPPNVFLDSATSIKAKGMAPTGWTRLVVEKPFGRDMESATELADNMNAIFTEQYIYRIDHYLGKEIVQNLIMLRFGNGWLEPLMNHNHVASVQICFKENFGTGGRGGYFDSFGIIRDIMQNHLTQVLSLVAMEPPTSVNGPASSEAIRSAKVQLLRCVEPVHIHDMVTGQYVGDGGENEGYLDDEGVPDDSVTPTYAVAIMKIRNPRWDGVPFIMKAGKALNERKAEIRIQFKKAPAADFMFGQDNMARNELVMRIQPNEAIYLKCNVKAPGLHSEPITSEMDLSYKHRYGDVYSPDAYTRLVLDILRGDQASFVAREELLESWRVWTPVLEDIEGDGVKPLPYEFGSRGPPAGDELVKSAGFARDATYVWDNREGK